MLYNKQLHSLEELRAERLALRQQSQQLLADTTRKESSSQDSTDVWTDRLTALSVNLLGNSKYADLIQTATKIALPFVAQQIKTKATRKIVGKVAKEVALGYLKWKAISLVVGIVAHKIKKKKEAQ